MRASRRVRELPPYLFASIQARKARAIARGLDVIDLGAGVPDFPTPDHVLRALHQAADDPASHRYPPYEGTLAFKSAVARYYERRFGVRLDPKCEVMALIGSKEGIVNLFYAFLDPGDLALIPDPGYPAYATAARLALGEPYSLPLDPHNGWLPDFEAIPEAVARRAKLLFLNYPNNPTGAVGTRECFERAIAWARVHDVLVAHDLAYGEIAFDGHVAPSILEVDGARDVAIEFNSLSKSYNMTGWRIGMAVGAKEAIRALGVIKSNTDTGLWSAVQQAGIAALEGPQDHLRPLLATYQERRDALVAGLRSLGWEVTPNAGAFYLWARVPIGWGSAAFADTMLDELGIVVPPGTGYGAQGEGWFRMALTQDVRRLEEAIRRMKEAGLTYHSAEGAIGT